MIREFFYVDVQRTRSLLAQLDEGVLEHHVETTALGDIGELGASVFGIGGKGSWSVQESLEEARSLKDLTFVIFEEAADEQGIIVDTDLPADIAAWSTGEVHQTIREGQILRVSGDVLITDPTYVANRFDGLSGFLSALVEMQVSAGLEAARELTGPQVADLERKLANANKNQRRQIEKKLTTLNHQIEQEVRQAVEQELGGDIGLEQMRNVMQVMQSFIGQSIAVRVLACGPDHPEMGLAGSLLGREEYLQRERDELFSRYGSMLKHWTVVAQVADIPTEEETSASMELDTETWSDFVSGKSINRAAFERAAQQLLRMMESIGIAEGPRWPTISIVPLGIYRPIPG